MLRFLIVTSLSSWFVACSGSDAGGTGGSGGGLLATSVGNGNGSVTSATHGASSPSSNQSGTVGAKASSAATGSGQPGNPPFGGSSGGTGGPSPVAGEVTQTGNISYRLVVPSTYAGQPTPFLLVYSGTEGGEQMTQNLISVGPSTGTDGFIRAILDGVQYNGDGTAGATVLDDVRAHYDIDNDRTYLLGESAGTTAAEELGFQLRESYFAAYWANDVVAPATPGQDAAAIGFQPWGQVGPGGQLAIAQQIVSGMQTSNYRVPSPAPYAGSGSNTHGDPQQFLAAVTWFAGKSRM